MSYVIYLHAPLAIERDTRRESEIECVDLWEDGGQSVDTGFR